MTIDANLGSVKVHKRPGSSHRLHALRDALRIVFRGKDKSHASCYRVSCNSFQGTEYSEDHYKSSFQFCSFLQFHIHEQYSHDADKSSRKGFPFDCIYWLLCIQRTTSNYKSYLHEVGQGVL